MEIDINHKELNNQNDIKFSELRNMEENLNENNLKYDYNENLLFDEIDEKIIVKNFKENMKSYTISKFHKKQLDRNKVYFELEKELYFEENTKIINIKFHISKSIKYIILSNEIFKTDINRNKILKNEIEIIYFNEDLNIVNTFYIQKKINEYNSSTNKLYYDNDINDINRISDDFRNFKVYYNFVYIQFKDSIKISHIENFSAFLVDCDLKNFLVKETNGENESIQEIIYKDYIFIYDQMNNYLIIFTEDFDMIILYPIVKFTNEKNPKLNVCNFIKYFSNFHLKKLLGIKSSNELFNKQNNLELSLINIEIIRNDLLINFNQLGKILLINLDKFEEAIENNFFQFRIVNTRDINIENESLNILDLTDNKDKNSYRFNLINQNINEEISKNKFIRNTKLSSEIAFSKNTFSNFIIIQNFENPNILQIYEIHNPHSKLVGGDYSFLNFKIPIIFIAMIIIFFYHFFKKKRELNEENPRIKKEVFRYLEDSGAFNKKSYKEEIDKKNPFLKYDTVDNHMNKKEDREELDNSIADESLNNTQEENYSDKISDEDNYKKKIIDFLKKKN